MVKKYPAGLKPPVEARKHENTLNTCGITDQVPSLSPIKMIFVNIGAFS